MNQMLGIVFVGSVLSGRVPAGAAALRRASPMAQLTRSTDALINCIRQQYPSWSPEADAQRMTVRRLLDGSIDYTEISRRALGLAWGQLSAPQRVAFVADLGKVIESRYLNGALYPGSDLRVSFVRETISHGGTASVFGLVLAQARNRPLRMTVEYRLIWKGDHWAVYDVVTDGNSLLDQYRDQFSRIIARESLAGLLRRIREQAESRDDGR